MAPTTHANAAPLPAGLAYVEHHRRSLPAFCRFLGSAHHPSAGGCNPFPASCCEGITDCLSQCWWASGYLVSSLGISLIVSKNKNFKAHDTSNCFRETPRCWHPRPRILWSLGDRWQWKSLCVTFNAKWSLLNFPRISRSHLLRKRITSISKLF